MRVEPYSVGSVVHIIKRGGRGMEIVRDDGDRWRFVRSLFILNDLYQDPGRNFVMYESQTFVSVFERPEEWPERRPLVAILGWTLLDNHLHLLVQEINEGGIAKFMQRLGGSMSLAFNEKYGTRGSIFQGAYKSRTVDSNEYLQYVHAYITAKNVFDMYPGGVKKAMQEFEKAWKFASEYTFSSFLTAAIGAPSPILDMKVMDDLGLIRKDFKEYARSMLATHAQSKEMDEELGALILEEW
ncbi:MAG: transposase [Parcubacteria group bacterium]